MDRSDTDTPESILNTELRFIKLQEVLSISGKSKTSIYDAVKSGAFPPPVKLGVRSSAWIKSEVLQWADSCVKASRPKDDS